MDKIEKIRSDVEDLYSIRPDAFIGISAKEVDGGVLETKQVLILAGASKLSVARMFANLIMKAKDLGIYDLVLEQEVSGGYKTDGYTITTH